MAVNAKELFGVSGNYDNSMMPKCSLLELGSGLGRAGIMAAKIIQSEGYGGTCVLTDGEDEIVEMLRQNCAHNGVFERSRMSCVDGTAADVLQGDVDCICQPLWWGDRASLDALLAAHPSGFDIIIGTVMVCIC